MRDIKFRGVHIESGSMVYGDLIRKTDFDGKKYFEIEQSVANDYHNWTVKPETVGQYSGKKDCKGNEIYEGDWLRVTTGYISHVIFDDGMFLSVYQHLEDGETVPLNDVIGPETEVVGNVHLSR